MAYDFKGTFNTSGFNRFVAFARAQQTDLVQRIIHLQQELLRTGSLSFAYDEHGVPQQFEPDEESYIARLVAAYEVLGGDPFFDLNIRSRSQAVFLIAGDETVSATTMSNGEAVGLPGRADAASGALIESMREWSEGVIEYKRDYLERKIRRAVDYADQLQDEIDLLTLLMGPVDTTGSFENIFSALNQLIANPEYRAIFDDKGNDPNMKNVDAPFTIYDAGPDRAPGVSPGRDEGGYLPPGGTVL